MARSGGAVFRSALRHLTALLCVNNAFSARIPQRRWWHPNVESYFKVSSRRSDGYATFQDVHYRRIATRASAVIEKDLILPLQWLSGKPVCWDMVTLVGYGQTATRLAIRIDNLYLAGFANRTGHWHAFPRSAHLIPGSVPLRFGDSYPRLAGIEGHEYLHNIQLGREAMLEAVSVLSEYDSDTGDEELLKRALLVIIICVCEAARFSEIKEHISAGWWTGTYLTARHERYLIRWAEISCAILIYEHSGSWRSNEAKLIAREFGIMSYSAALSKVDVIIQSTRCSDEVTKFTYRNQQTRRPPRVQP